MCKWQHNLIRISVVLIAIGVIVLGVALVASDFEFSTLLGSGSLEHSEQVFEDTLETIHIEGMNADVHLLPSEDGRCHLIIDEMEKGSCSAETEEGVLSIYWTRKWHWKDIFNFSFGSPRLTIYLPEHPLSNLNILTTSGDIKIENCSAGQMELETDSGTIQVEKVQTTNFGARSSSGNLSIDALTCEQTARINTGSGDIRLKGGNASHLEFKSNSGQSTISALQLDNLQGESKSGDVGLENVQVGQALNLTSTSGNLHLKNTDAFNFDLKSESGDIRGSLPSPKYFSASSGSGKVFIPESVPNQGNFNARSSSGDIQIEIQ